MDTVAHDLRSPLASIKAVLESLALGVMGKLSDNAVKRIRGAEGSADRLLRLINDLLDFDKYESGQFTLYLQSHSIQEICYSSIVSIESLIEGKHLTTAVEGEDYSVNVDGDRLTQALVNIISNAVKFSPDGGNIKITTRQKNKQILVEIADQGPGIPDKFKSDIFRTFQTSRIGSSQTQRDRARTADRKTSNRGFTTGRLASKIIPAEGRYSGLLFPWKNRQKEHDCKHTVKETDSTNLERAFGRSIHYQWHRSQS